MVTHPPPKCTGRGYVSSHHVGTPFGDLSNVGVNWRFHEFTMLTPLPLSPRLKPSRTQGVGQHTIERAESQRLEDAGPLRWESHQKNSKCSTKLMF